jgi:hypothetical protein
VGPGAVVSVAGAGGADGVLPAEGAAVARRSGLSVARAKVTWVDVTAPGDGCAFALCDPVAVSGVAPPRGSAGRWWSVGGLQRRPCRPSLAGRTEAAVLPAAFPVSLRLRRLKGGPEDYDYFRITAGAQTLADRYRTGRPGKKPDQPGATAIAWHDRLHDPAQACTPRPDRVSLLAYLRLFRRDILSAQPARLYRAWMAEFRTPFFRSYMCNDPALVAPGADERPDDFPKSDRIREGLLPLWAIRSS